MRMLESDPERPISLDIHDGELVVAVTREELSFLVGAINEALEAVETWEFESRLGVDAELATSMMARIGEIVRESSRPL